MKTILGRSLQIFLLVILCLVFCFFVEGLKTAPKIFAVLILFAAAFVDHRWPDRFRFLIAFVIITTLPFDLGFAELVARISRLNMPEGEHHNGVQALLLGGWMSVLIHIGIFVLAIIPLAKTTKGKRTVWGGLIAATILGIALSLVMALVG